MSLRMKAQSVKLGFPQPARHVTERGGMASVSCSLFVDVLPVSAGAKLRLWVCGLQSSAETKERNGKQMISWRKAEAIVVTN